MKTTCIVVAFGISAGVFAAPAMAAGRPELDGDFNIDAILDNPARECASAMLPVRYAANRVWFAAGNLRRQFPRR